MHSSTVGSFCDTIDTQKQKFGFMGEKCINAYNAQYVHLWPHL